MGKIRAPFYRVVVMDVRTKRDGRAIEEIGKYHPTAEPSVIEIDSDRAQHWLGSGAQPTEAVAASAEGHRRLAEVQGPARCRGHPAGGRAEEDKKELYEAAVAAAGMAPAWTSRTPRPARRPLPPRPPLRPRLPRLPLLRLRPPRLRLPRLRLPRLQLPRPRPRPPRSPPTPTPVARRPRATTPATTRRRPPPTPKVRVLIVLEEALEHLVKGIVDHSDDVVVLLKELAAASCSRSGCTPTTSASVIGRSGRTASALRTVVTAPGRRRPGPGRHRRHRPGPLSPGLSTELRCSAVFGRSPLDTDKHLSSVESGRWKDHPVSVPGTGDEVVVAGSASRTGCVAR